MKFKPYCSLVTIIFVIMLTAYHFGNILESNSYFQRILIAVNKITHDINYNHDYIQYIYLDIKDIYIQTWNCIDTRNLGKLYEKSNVMQFLSDHVI